MTSLHLWMDGGPIVGSAKTKKQRRALAQLMWSLKSGKARAPFDWETERRRFSRAFCVRAL